MKYEIHPACAAWPQMNDKAFADLVASVREHGLIQPIILIKTQILDGKERQRACDEAGVTPHYMPYLGDDPVGYSLAVNKHRRHLPIHELIFIAEKLATLKKGAPLGNSNANKTNTLASAFVSNNETYAEIAAACGNQFHPNRIGDARAILEKGESNVIEMAKTGKVGINATAAYVRHTPREEQRNDDVAAVKRKGNDIKEGRASARPKSKPTITIPLSDVIDKLRPLIKRVKEQSKRHQVQVSTAELCLIVHALEQLVDSWTKGASENGTRSDPAPLTRVR